jgi:two-component system chemotaxis response regulator CheY
MAIKILIVDDSPTIRRLIRHSIESHTDWIVCGEAENGKIAVAMVDQLRPDLVSLDLSMPVMNGLDAAREILTIVPGMPIVMFTMHESVGLGKQAQRVGIQCVFCKANGFGNDVLEAMRKMLSSRAA